MRSEKRINMEFECTEKPLKLCRVHVHVYDHFKKFDHCFLTIRLNYFQA